MYLNVKQWYEFAKFRAFRAFVCVFARLMHIGAFVPYSPLSLRALLAFVPYLPSRLTYPDFYTPYLRALLMRV